jgi:hypothetical protein
MASTYVNDLRLNEMATGDGSGTWGTTTNTNLELIAEAFSYGTEAITTNADTHTTTIADGATDPGRSLYLKYTGTLDSACTITIGPNTVSKVWIIENGTSGSQDIILSQGSGANITIPAGDTKVVYSDGAGAGAAFFDAFASINVGDLTATTFTSTGIDDNADATAITIDSSENVMVGKSSLGIGVDGTEIRAGGQLLVTADGDNPVDFNRKTSDGVIALFRKDGTAVGSIACKSGSMYIGSNLTPSFIKFSTNTLQPCTSVGGDSDNTLTLGDSSNRFKDLYLSGGAYLGGTVAANLLDDYEEGTWTPTGSLSATVYCATYTKIGRVVTIQLHILFGSSASTATADNIAGLPFAVSNISDIISPLTIWKDDAGGNTNYDIQAHVYQNESRIRLTAVGGVAKTYAQISDGYYAIGGSYFTDS